MEAVPRLVSGLVLGGGGELGQLAGVVPSTFDVVDLAMVALAFVFGLVLAPSTADYPWDATDRTTRLGCPLLR